MASDLETQRRTVRIDVFDAEQSDNEDWPPEDAGGFLAWINDKLGMVPAEHAGSARVTLSSAPIADDPHCARIAIGYERDETEEDRITR